MMPELWGLAGDVARDEVASALATLDEVQRDWHTELAIEPVDHDAKELAWIADVEARLTQLRRSLLASLRAEIEPAAAQLVRDVTRVCGAEPAEWFDGVLQQLVDGVLTQAFGD